MSNPQSIINFNKFIEWKQQRDELCDWEDYVLSNRLGLNKKMVARECEFDRKRITGNGKIYEVWKQIEEELLQKGILEEDNKTPSQKLNNANTITKQAIENRRSKAQQEKNATLEQELYDIKSELIDANKKLEKLKMLEEYMMRTGKL
ncbi:hypothetical protein ESZ36_00330 [Colwellia demingiae]|uniref:Uncharacterized protein n=1 Tax=Colwellia demingiae TaxID=89401 RepID=A0A5C6QSY2_9GAMM|nr:hypothetical protein [Colwellia demingiae]TWX71718.1 hypothetical protein ESZ36_00330 [Colwellia demingiae]